MSLFFALGSFSVFKYLIGVLNRVRRAETGTEQDPQPSHPMQSLITFFLCGWFITGTRTCIVRPTLLALCYQNAGWCESFNMKALNWSRPCLVDCCAIIQALPWLHIQQTSCK